MRLTERSSWCFPTHSAIRIRGCWSCGSFFTTVPPQRRKGSSHMPRIRRSAGISWAEQIPGQSTAAATASVASISAAASMIATYAVDPTCRRPGLRCIEGQSRYAFHQRILPGTIISSIPPIPWPGARVGRYGKDADFYHCA